MNQSIRQRPAFLRALGAHEPPFAVEIQGEVHRLIEVFKHDSWAATARYRGTRGDVVCKFNRTQSLFGTPLSWLGRWLARRESAALAALAGVPGIPPLCGPVASQGKPLPHAVAHEFIPGHPLRRDEPVNDCFFARLRILLNEVHRRDLAYVDLHKRENVLVGDDGQPYLFDFQICFGLRAAGRWRRFAFGRLLGLLQQIDLYHLAKHARRLRPDQLAALGLQHRAAPPIWIRLHRTVAVPFRIARRRLLTLLGVRGSCGQATTEVFPEIAVRQELRRAA